MTSRLDALLPWYTTQFCQLRDSEGKSQPGTERGRDIDPQVEHPAASLELVRLGERVHPTLKQANTPRREAHVTDHDKRRREAEQHLTEELANQAKQEPGSAAEEA